MKIALRMFFFTLQNTVINSVLDSYKKYIYTSVRMVSFFIFSAALKDTLYLYYVVPRFLTMFKIHYSHSFLSLSRSPLSYTCVYSV